MTHPLLAFVGAVFFLPFAFLAYLFSYGTIAVLGVIVFAGFGAAGIFLDTTRWFGNQFKENIKPNEENMFRLKKAMKIFIFIFSTMGELEAPLLGPDRHVPLPL